MIRSNEAQNFRNNLNKVQNLLHSNKVEDAVRVYKESFPVENVNMQKMIFNYSIEMLNMNNGYLVDSTHKRKKQDAEKTIKTMTGLLVTNIYLSGVSYDTDEKFKSLPKKIKENVSKKIRLENLFNAESTTTANKRLDLVYQ